MVLGSILAFFLCAEANKTASRKDVHLWNGKELCVHGDHDRVRLCPPFSGDLGTCEQQVPQRVGACLGDGLERNGALCVCWG